MSNAFIGEIRPFAFSYCPQGWLPCDGTVYLIQQYTALYSIIGTRFGGNGQTNFAVPDLRGATPMGQGQGPNLSNRPIATFVGTEQAVAELPPHNHGLNYFGPGYAKAATSYKPSPTANTSYPSRYIKLPNDPTQTASAVANKAFAPTSPPIPTAPPHPAAMNTASIGATGSSTPHENRQPFLALQFCICSEDGVYPPFDD